MSRQRKNFYLDEETIMLLEKIQTEKGLSTFGEAIDLVVKRYTSAQSDYSFADVLSEKISATVLSEVKTMMEPLRIRTAYADKQLKLFRHLVNHYLLFSQSDIFAGEIVTTDEQRAKQIKEVDEKISQQIIHFKQRKDYKQPVLKSEKDEDDLSAF